MSIAEHFGHASISSDETDSFLHRAAELDKRFAPQFVRRDFTYTRPREDMAYLPKSLHGDHSICCDHYAPISYNVWQGKNAEARTHTVIVLGGIFNTARLTDFYAERASERANIIVLDYPGKGDSGNFRLPADYTLANYAKVVTKLIDELDVTQGFTLFGNSHGVKVIYQMVEMGFKNPHWKSTILGDMGPETPEGPKERRSWRNREMPNFHTLPEAVRAFRSFQRVLGSPIPEDFVIHGFNHSFAFHTRQGFGWGYDPNSMQGYCDEYLAVPYSKWRAHKDIPTPILMLVGADSNTVDENIRERMLDVRPDSSLFLFEATGHYPELLTQAHVDHVWDWIDSSGKQKHLIIPQMSEPERVAQPLEMPARTATIHKFSDAALKLARA